MYPYERHTESMRTVSGICAAVCDSIFGDGGDGADGGAETQIAFSSYCFTFSKKNKNKNAPEAKEELGGGSQGGPKTLPKCAQNGPLGIKKNVFFGGSPGTPRTANSSCV